VEIIEARFQYQTGLMPEAITCELSVSLVATHLLDQSSEQWQQSYRKQAHDGSRKSYTEP